MDKFPSSFNVSPHSRFSGIDALRGVAMVWMTVFHFCFDLNFFGWWQQDFSGDAFWTLQRTAIVGLFVFCAGLGQAVAHEQDLGWPRFWRRWLKVALCALLVSVASWFMFPRSFIYFGVLHGMLVMLVLARWSGGWGRCLWPLGLVAIAAPLAAQMLLTGPWAALAPAMDARPLNWLGLITRKPFTEDYVPVLPWLGVMWWGVATGRWLLHNRRHWLGLRVGGSTGRLLVFLGNHSLLYYMLHQPLMIGALVLVGWLVTKWQ